MGRLTYRNENGSPRLCDRLNGIGICLYEDVEQVAQYEDKIPELEKELANKDLLVRKYHKEAARYRTLYYNLLRRYQDATE